MLLFFPISIHNYIQLLLSHSYFDHLALVFVQQLLVFSPQRFVGSTQLTALCRHTVMGSSHLIIAKED